MQPGYYYTDAIMTPAEYWSTHDDLNDEAHNNVLERIVDLEAEGAQELQESIEDLLFNADGDFKKELVSSFTTFIAETIKGNGISTKNIASRRAVLNWFKEEQKREVLAILDRNQI